MICYDLVLWDINLYRLFSTKLFYKYFLNTSDLVWFGFMVLYHGKEKIHSEIELIIY